MFTTVDALFGLIQVSTSVKIKRFDDRIHLAKLVQLSSELNLLVLNGMNMVK
jgi:hypothetical protein